MSNSNSLLYSKQEHKSEILDYKKVMKMEKLSSSNTQTQKSTTTRKSERFLRQLHPTLLKSLLGVILTGLSIILKYQSPEVTIAFSADVSQSNQEYKAIISVSFQHQREVQRIAGL